MQAEKKYSLDDWLYGIGWALLPLAGIGYLIFERTRGWTSRLFCPVDSLLGIYCPGCGGTRAVWLLLHGHPLMSLWYHPLVLYGVVFYVIYMTSQTFARLTGYRLGRGLVFHERYLYGAVLVLAVNFLVKNLLRLVWHVYL